MEPSSSLCDGTRGDGQKWKQRKFPLNIMEHFLRAGKHGTSCAK